MLNSQEQFFHQLSTAKNIAVVFNKNWSSDSLAAGLALSQLLLKLGHKITLAADQTDKQTQLSWLPFYPFVLPDLDTPKYFIISLDASQTKIKNLKYRLTPEQLDIVMTPEPGSILPKQISTQAGGFVYDAALILGCPDLDSLGSIYTNQPDFFQQTVLINLDSAPANEAYGQINLVDPKASSVSEIVWRLFAEQSNLIDPDIATCLLAGIITATDNFKNNNLSPQTLSVAADLIKLGARREEIINQLYRNKQIETLKLWGTGLSHLSVSTTGKLAWTFFDYQDLKEANCQRQNLLALVEELIANLNDLEAVVIFVTKGQETLALVYSLKNFDALALTKNYQGQGNKKLAQILLNQPLDAAIKELVPVFNEELKS